MPSIEKNSGEVRVGIESAFGFGDCLFNTPLLREISRKYRTKVSVAVTKGCKDAFDNIPWVSELIEIERQGDGIRHLKSLGCVKTFQVTQNSKFFEFKAVDPCHSLIDTPLATGLELGLTPFNQRPIVRPTNEEITATSSLANFGPSIAIESEFRSGQSWATADDMQQIVHKHQERILWLSNVDAPKLDHVDDMLRYTRRECIASLRFCKRFYSVGSGFFCAALGLVAEFQPTEIVCLWDNSLFRYRERLQELNWHPRITWLENRSQLMSYLDTNHN